MLFISPSKGATSKRTAKNRILCHNSPLWNMFSVRMCVIAAVSNMDGWLISFRAEQQQRDRKLMGGNGGDFKERGRKPTNLWPSHCHTTIFETQGDFQRCHSTPLWRKQKWQASAGFVFGFDSNIPQVWQVPMETNNKLASLEGITASQITGLFQCPKKNCHDLHVTLVIPQVYFKRFQSRRSWCVWLFFLFDMGWEQLLDTSASRIVVVVVLPTVCRIFVFGRKTARQEFIGA